VRGSKYIVLLLFFILSSQIGRSQGISQAEIPITLRIPEVALIDFEGSTRLISFESSPQQSNQIDQIVTPSTMDKTWINYSSIIKEGRTNTISVYISSGKLPPYTSIELDIGGDVGAGAGSLGNSSAPIILSQNPQNIITNIGSCYTGKGINKGHQLSYSWIRHDGPDNHILTEDSFSIVVTFTISSTDS